MEVERKNGGEARCSSFYGSRVEGSALPCYTSSGQRGSVLQAIRLVACIVTA
jgi:hypothetical protein